MMLFMIEVPSGHHWLVEAESAEDALAEWPTDAETAIGVHKASEEEARYAVEYGESDVSPEAVDDYFESEPESESESEDEG